MSEAVERPEENPLGVVRDLGDSLAYSRCKFSTTLPKHYQYTAGHFWIAPGGSPGVWRVGFTKFATRMLGDMVEMQFHVTPGQPVELGKAIGWFEGLKAVTDLYCVIAGEFVGANTTLDEQTDLVQQDPYRAGWLYEVRGTADPESVGPAGYIDILNATIDKLQAD